jgi:ABC-type uncharacterized transport system permease subunit
MLGVLLLLSFIVVTITVFTAVNRVLGFIVAMCIGVFFASVATLVVTYTPIDSVAHIALALGCYAFGWYVHVKIRQVKWKSIVNNIWQGYPGHPGAGRDPDGPDV